MSIENPASRNVLPTAGQNRESFVNIFSKLARPMNFDCPMPFQSSIPLYTETRIGANTRHTYRSKHGNTNAAIVQPDTFNTFKAPAPFKLSHR